MSRFARLPLLDMSESLAMLGETVEIVVGPRAFERAQEDAGPRMVWLDAGLFRFGSVFVRLAQPKEAEHVGELKEAARSLYDAWNADLPHVNKMFRLGRALVALGVELRTTHAKENEK